MKPIFNNNLKGLILALVLVLMGGQLQLNLLH